MNDLHVYTDTDDCDTVVAGSPDDALAVWCETFGEKRDDYQDKAFRQHPDDEILKVHDPDCEFSESGQPVSRTCREWCDQCGRGFLCSTEF